MKKSRYICNFCTQCSQFFAEGVISAQYKLTAIDHAFALCHKSEKHRRRATAKIGSRDPSRKYVARVDMHAAAVP